MRSKVFLASAFASLVLVSGCSGSEESATSGENGDVCTNFAADHNEFVGLVAEGPGSADQIEQWTSAKTDGVAKFSALATDASGDVGESIHTFVDGIPADTLELSAADSASGQAFVDNAKSVASACDADGAVITLDELPLLKFQN